MVIYTKGQVRISFIHRIVDEKGAFKSFSFRIWLGKTGYGSKIKDRYRNGVCYQELDIPMTEFTCQGKQQKKGVLYNPSFEIVDYDSDKAKKVCTVWKLKSFDKTQVAGEVPAEENFTEDNF